MRVIQSLNELVKFGESHKHINVYGAGVHANKIAKLSLKINKFDIDVFLVNDLTKNPNTIKGIPVKLATDAKVPREEVVLISLGVDTRDQAISYLENEGYNNLAVITEKIRFELSPSHTSSFNIKRDNLISDSKIDKSNTPLSPEIHQINEEIYQQNMSAFLDYKYIWKKTFPAFQDIDNKKITEISIKPQDKELFEQLNSNLPILLKDCYDTDWLKRMCGRLRSSEKYGSDNLLYLEYSSLDTFIAMMAVMDWREVLATEKVVFLFDEHEKKEKYPILKEKFGEIQPLVVDEIKTLIRTSELKSHSGTAFFNMIMDTHPYLLTAGRFGLTAYTVLYKKILKGYSVTEAINRMKNPLNDIEHNIIDLNINPMIISNLSSLSIAKRKEMLFEHLSNILGKDNTPSSVEWFKGFYLANAECFHRKYADRLVPAIFYDYHGSRIYCKAFHLNDKEVDEWQNDLHELYDEFDEELIISVCRDPLTSTGSSWDDEFDNVMPRNSQSNEYEKSPLLWLIDEINNKFSIFVRKNSDLYKKWRIVRFEDLKLHPHETLAKLCEFLHIPKTNSMLSCTINKENVTFMGTRDFDPAPVYKKHDKYLGVLDRYRLEMLHQKDYKVWGYKLKYYDGVVYTPRQIKKLFSLPYSIERAFWGDKLLASKLKREIVERALDIIKNGESVPYDEDNNEMVPVEWLKPDLSEGQKLYE